MTTKKRGKTDEEILKAKTSSNLSKKQKERKRELKAAEKSKVLEQAKNTAYNQKKKLALLKDPTENDEPLGPEHLTLGMLQYAIRQNEKGVTAKELANIILNTYNIKVNPRVLSDKMREIRMSRANTAKRYANQILKRSVTQDLDFLDELISGVREIFLRNIEEGNDRIALQAVDRAERLIARSLKIKGIDSTIETNNVSVTMQYNDILAQYGLLPEHLSNKTTVEVIDSEIIKEDKDDNSKSE